MDSKYILQSLNDTISSRKGGDPESSYVAYLFAKGQDEILKKIVEEAGEVVLASKDDDKIKWCELNKIDMTKIYRYCNRSYIQLFITSYPTKRTLK